MSIPEIVDMRYNRTPLQESAKFSRHWKKFCGVGANARGEVERRHRRRREGGERAREGWEM